MSSPLRRSHCSFSIPALTSSRTNQRHLGWGDTEHQPGNLRPLLVRGFSNYFPAPSYQAAAKVAYLNKLGSTYAGRFSTFGRGFPGVAAAGTNLGIVWKGNVTSVTGTSSSGVVFASVVSLLSDRRSSRPASARSAS